MNKINLENMQKLIKSQEKFRCQVATQNIWLAIVHFKLKLPAQEHIYTPGKTFKPILILLIGK